MGAPSWLAGLLAVAMIGVAGYCVARLGSAWRWRRPTELDADGVHAVMGVAMAGMLVTGLRTLPASAWEAVFGLAACWFAVQAVRARRGALASPWRCPHPLPHVVESAAMLYMLAAARGPARAGSGSGAGGMGMPGGASHFPVLALALAVFACGYVMWLGDRLTMPAPVPAGSGPAPAAALAPRGAACCKIAMSVTMGYMLVLML